MRVFRLRFSINGSIRTWIVKRLAPEIAKRNELVAKRWLPAVGLNDLGPPLPASGPGGGDAWVGAVSQDLVPHGLEPQAAHLQPVRPAQERIHRMRSRFQTEARLVELG